MSTDNADEIQFDICKKLVVSFEKDLCPTFQRKLEHSTTEGKEATIRVTRGLDRRDIRTNPRDKLGFLDDGYRPLVVAMKPTADELLVGDGSYEIVRQGGVYTVSPGNIACQGLVLDSWLEHGLFRPLFNSYIIPQGALLAHGAAVSVKGKVLLFLGESGKTSTMLELMGRGADFMADEYTLLDPKGVCWMYTPYLWMDDRHFIHFPELLETAFADSSERKRVDRQISFFRMGYLAFKGNNLFSRQVRELLTTKCYFEGLTCRYDRPFPKARCRESGKIDHVFHLESRRISGLVTPADHQDIASMESGVMAIRHGHLEMLAHLSGLPFPGYHETMATFSKALSHAECHHVGIGIRGDRRRNDFVAIADSIMDMI